MRPLPLTLPALAVLLTLAAPALRAQTVAAAIAAGDSARCRRNSEVALADFRAALALDSLHDGALHVMGRWNAEIQRLPGITKFFARTFLGASIFSEASWKNANRYFRDAIRINPSNIYHHLDLAEALVDQDSTAEARTELEQVAQLPLGCDPGDSTYKEQAAALLQKISRR